MSMVFVILLWILGSTANGMVSCRPLLGALAGSVPGNELRNLLNCSCFEFPTSISALIAFVFIFFGLYQFGPGQVINKYNSNLARVTGANTTGDRSCLRQRAR